MLAMLNTGEFVTLDKECACLHHEGPHWLHMSKVSRSLNLKIGERGGQLANYAFAKAEIRRLDELLYEMRIRDIAEIVNGLSEGER